jgi:hypothetical protein
MVWTCPPIVIALAFSAGVLLDGVADFRVAVA